MELHNGSGSGGGAPLTVTDGITTVTSVTEINFTSGTTVTNAGGGTADVAISGGSGSPGGANTQLQYNNAGNFGGITGATTNGTVVTLTAPVVATSLTGSYLTASEILITDGSKNIVSAPVATYPSLTELTYLRGVTSAIQTQLNAKGVGTVTSVAMSVPTGLTITGSPVTTTGTLAVALDTGYVIPLQTTLDGFVKTDQTVGQTIGLTGARLTKLWATDITVTNAIAGSITGNAATVTNATLTTALTVNTGTLTLTANAANTSVLTIGAGAVSVSGSNTGDQTLASLGAAASATTITIAGTANQITSSAGAQDLSANRTWTLSLPQDIATSSTPQFAKLGLGAAADANRLLLVTGDVSGGVATINRTNASTNGVLGTVIIKGTSAGDMTDGFGSAFQFAIQDTAAVENLIANIRAFRGGADTTGDMDFGVYVAGVATPFLGLDGSAGEIYALKNFVPSTNDLVSLGTSSLGFSDLFLAEGGVINWDNGDVTLTQTGNVLAVAGGDLRVATADVGTNADSVPTLSSTSTFTNKTLTAPTINAATLSGDIVLAEGGNIELDSVLSADGTYSGVTIDGTAGATLAFGDLVYLAAVDSRWELTDADAVGTAGTILIGMCVLAAAGDGSATKILLQGTIRADTAFPALTISAPVYVGETAGDVQVAIPTGADNVIRVVGFALTADSMYFNPSQDHQTTVA